jgi:ferritin-like metal-binding protein YciE
MHVVHSTSEKEMDPAGLKQFFVSHLNRIYCAKSQLEAKLPVIAGNCNAHDLRLAISQTIDVVTVQIGRLEEIYARL